MARRRLPRNTTGALAGTVLLEGEAVYDTSADRLKVGDGVTAGGVALARKAEIEVLTAGLAETNQEVEGKVSASAMSAVEADVGALQADVAALTLGQVTGAVVFDTKAHLDADLAYAANTKAEVYADGTPANNGVYRKSGASGSGAWTRISALATTALASSLSSLTGTVSETVEDAPLIGYSAIQSPYPITIDTRNKRATTFSGWGSTWARPSAISFNAVGLIDVPRGSVTAADRWRLVRVYVLTHATAPAGGDGTLVAEGWALVPPGANAIKGKVVALYVPGTTTLKTVTQADLLARFFVGYQVFSDEAGVVNAVAGETRGTRAGGLILVSSHYVTTENGATDAWPATGADELGIELLLLSDLTVTPATAPTEAFAQRRGLPTGDMAAPGPNDPILSPRLFGLQGYDAKMFFAGMCSGQAPKVFEIDGGGGLGRHETDQWRYPAPQGITSAGLVLSVEVRDADYLTVKGSGEIALYMPAIGVASAATKKGLDIGDSMVNAATMGARELARCAANPLGVQLTKLGTQGAGANKHEGRPGWKMSDYFETYQRTDGGVVRTNPFVGGVGQKFNAANYLANTGQATPDYVSWLLGANDIFSASSDLAVHLIMTGYLDKLDRMIGRTPDAAVGSWSEVNAGIAHLIGTPIPPAASQTIWGVNYAIGQSQNRFKRNVAIAAYRIIEHYRGAEAEHCFIVPYHLAIDTVAGFDATDGLHPNTAGYNDMGDQRYFALNVLVGEGKI